MDQPQADAEAVVREMEAVIGSLHRKVAVLTVENRRLMELLVGGQVEEGEPENAEDSP